MANVGDLTIRSNLYADGTLRGYGQITTTNTPTPSILVMNGKVVADGFGRELDLDLTHFSIIHNNIDNVESHQDAKNGWFAVHRGRLRLPTVTIPRNGVLWGMRTFHWGESAWVGALTESSSHTNERAYGANSPADETRTIDLINSVQVTFPSPPDDGRLYGDGRMTIELLAKDRSEITSGPALAGASIGYWRVLFEDFDDFPDSTRPVTLKFRYDHTNLSRAEEQLLQVRCYSGSGEWTKVTQDTPSPVDVIDHVIWASVPLVPGTWQYFVVVVPPEALAGKYWVWKQENGTHGWTEEDLANAPERYWDRIGFLPEEHWFADSLLYPAYINNGGTATIGTTDATSYMAADTLHLGKSPGGLPATECSGSVQMSDGELMLNHLRVAAAAGSTGTFTLTGGTLDVPDVMVGEGGEGQLLLGDALGDAGLLTGVRSLAVWCQHGSPCPGELKGFGVVEAAGGAILANSGKVIATGYGDPARVLDLSGFATIENPVPNPATGANGWYAEQQGKLVLPRVHVAASDTVPYNWGEEVYSPTHLDIDLVNSLQIAPVGTRTTGDLNIALLAPDRSTAPVSSSPAAPRLAAYPALGIWEFQPPIPITSADVTIRYDHTVVGLDESLLALGTWVDGKWRIVDWAPANVDPTKHLFTKSGVSFPSNKAFCLTLVQRLVGDIDLSGTIDVVDLLILADSYDASSGDPRYDRSCDLNSDGVVDADDEAILTLHWGESFTLPMMQSQMTAMPQSPVRQMAAATPSPTASGIATLQAAPQVEEQAPRFAGPFNQAMLAGAWVSDDGGEMLIIDDSGNVTSIWEAPDGPGYEIPCDGLPHVDMPEDRVAIDPHQYVLGQDGQVTVTPFVYTLIPEDTSIPPASETISGQGWLLDETHMTINVTCGTGEAASAVAVTYTKRAVAP